MKYFIANSNGKVVKDYGQTFHLFEVEYLDVGISNLRVYEAVLKKGLTFNTKDEATLIVKQLHRNTDEAFEIIAIPPVYYATLAAEQPALESSYTVPTEELNNDNDEQFYVITQQPPPGEETTRVLSYYNFCSHQLTNPFAFIHEGADGIEPLTFSVDRKEQAVLVLQMIRDYAKNEKTASSEAGYALQARVKKPKFYIVYDKDKDKGQVFSQFSFSSDTPTDPLPIVVWAYGLAAAAAFKPTDYETANQILAMAKMLEPDADIKMLRL